MIDKSINQDLTTIQEKKQAVTNTHIEDHIIELMKENPTLFTKILGEEISKIDFDDLISN